MICQSLQRARAVLVYEKSHLGEVVYGLDRLGRTELERLD